MTREEMLKRFYDNYADHYWSVNNKKDVKKDSMIYDSIYAEYLPENKSGRALDCGSGGGIFLYFLKRHGFIKSFGIDLCQELVDFQNNELGVKAMHGDAIAYLRSAKTGFELITATVFVEHMSKNEIIEFMTLAAEKISQSGRVFIQVPNMGNPFTVRTQSGDFTHEVGFTEQSLAFMASSCGFGHVHIISSFPFNKEPESMQLLRDLYMTVGNAMAPKVLSKNVIAICSHQAIVASNQGD